MLEHTVSVSITKRTRTAPPRCAARLLVAALLLLFAACEAAHAVDPQQKLAQLHHTVWTSRDGCPGDVSVLAQTSDGFLWVGSSTGLYRFDGKRFQRFDTLFGSSALADDISALHATPEGGLWIGHRLGGAHFLQAGRLHAYGVREGLPENTVLSFLEEDQGVVWAGTSVGLYRLSGQTWTRVPVTEKHAAPALMRLSKGRDGTVWLSSFGPAFYRLAGESVYREIASDKCLGYVTLDADSEAWVVDAAGTHLLLDPSRRIDFPSSAAGHHSVMLVDREGSAWLSDGRSIGRIGSFADAKRSGRVDEIQTLRNGDRLSAGIYKDALEDRDGNVWVATSGGLNRFRTNRLTAVDSDEMTLTAAALAPDEHGGIWAGTDRHGLLNVNDKVSAHTVMNPDTPAGGILHVHRDSSGTLWMSGREELWRFDGRSAVPVALPAHTRTVIHAMVMDASGDLWISIVAEGVFRLHQGKWLNGAGSKDVPQAPTFSMHAAADGSVWLGYTNGSVAVVRGDSARWITPRNGLAAGSVLAICTVGHFAWIGGANGLALVDDHRVVPVVDAQGSRLAGVSGIVATPNGDLWLNGANGVTRVVHPDAAAVIASASHSVDSETFTSLDGLEGSPAQFRENAVRSTDGRLWFSTTEGVYWLDPQRVPRSASVPRVLVQALTSDETGFKPTDDLELPEQTTSLRIDYTAPGLTMPERVRFRYRLDGVDSTWQHADTRREAFYTALRPGHYLFHVTASNEDGIWSEQEAVASFRIRPAYYQTTWFLLLCALAVLALLWSLYVFRLRQLATQMRMRAEARLQERERIARDLHETLMQGTQSVVRGFQVIANELAPNDPVRQRMESSLGHADSVMADSREKLLSLRTVGPARTNLLQQLALVGVQHCPAQGIPFSTKLAGKPRQLVADVFDELYNIGSEAIVNACHHARALSIDVELAYEAARVRLTVRDDGIGIDATTHVTGSRSGHWGLPGMRERALSIGAVLAIESVPGVGTEIVVQVPAALAYGDEQWDTRWRRSWRKAWRRLSRRASR